MNKYAELTNQLIGLKNAIKAIEKGIETEQDSWISIQQDYIEEKTRLVVKEINRLNDDQILN